MTPTTEQVVAACTRAGIPVRIIKTGRASPDAPSKNGWLCFAVGPDHYYVDQPEGSALFIVAVFRALKDNRPMLLWLVEMLLADDPLTAACMAAIVAAYPEEQAP